MPRRGQNQETPDWNALAARAAACAGYVDVADAHAAGFSNQMLRYYTQTGRLQRPIRGVYRFARFPTAEHEDLVITWLWSGRTGVFSHDTALALHELSDAMPALHHLTVPADWEKRRLRVPSNVELHYADIDDGGRTWMGPVPITSVRRTLIDCVTESVSPELVEQAKSQIVRRGLMTKVEVNAALREARQ